MGKVYLVGGGPSDTELMTVKARRLIAEADVVVCDQLVGDAILSLIPADTEVIDVGKRSGNHTMPQEKINELLCDLSRDHNCVVRLKGGDPFLFGRGGEEVEEMLRQGVEYEIVPGVTSAISVPAYNGIPVTHRDFTPSVHIITGHRRAGQPFDLPFKAYVETKGTLVFLMGLAALPDIVAELKKAGMAGDMPAAVLSRGTTSGQKRVVSDLDHIEADVKAAAIPTPAIIVVGRVCGLSETFAWAEKRPLFGMKMYVTRPRDRASSLTEKLRKLGAEVIEIPTVKSVERPINDEIRAAYEKLGTYTCLGFTSPFGVTTFMNQLKALKMDIRAIGQAKIAAIGTGTKKALEDIGLQVDYMPEVYEGAAMGRLLGNELSDGDSVLLPRSAQGGQEILAEMKNAKNLSITDLPIYDTVKTELPAHHPLAAKPGIFEDEAERSYVLFTSASTVQGFAAMLPDAPFDKIKALCIGRMTAREAEKLGMPLKISQKATIDSLVELALDCAGC
ncbi:MAG: uroporphyrinogen-III C-methyltransferase [Lachnospiraceae bacterium]|nr:uroporphyrinogen-III C-methyltransferase [Lachnospiraceae bacterium]